MSVKSTPYNIYRVYESSANLGNIDHAHIDYMYKDYLRSHCYRPLKLSLYDSYLGRNIMRYVPCGHCYHCRESKQNEWVARLYYHLEDFKYCYFITLTYRSFELSNDIYSQYVYDYLSDALFHYDNKNHYKRYCYRPCVLVKSHYQNFFKRLRQRTGVNNLTYFGCGEYGKRHGAPHWHFLVFSHEPIKILDFRSSWGLRLSLDDNGNVRIKRTDSTSVFASFGRVQIDDLVLNGTISNKPVTIDGNKYSAKRCFKYVAKYVAKTEYNTSRVDAYYNTYVKFLIEDYEKNDSCLVHRSLSDWRSVYRPFVAVSRGTPIASLWFKRHFEEMAAGKFMPPPLQISGFIVPSYFRRKVSEAFSRLRCFTPRGSLSKGCLSQLAYSLCSSCETDYFKLFGENSFMDSKDYKPLPSLSVEYIANQQLTKLLESPECFVDIITRHRFLLVSSSTYLPDVIHVLEYHYVRGSGWTLLGVRDFAEWCRFYVTLMPHDFNTHMSNLDTYFYNTRYLEKVYDYYSEFDRLDTLNHMPLDIEEENDIFFELTNVSRYQNSKL